MCVVFCCRINNQTQTTLNQDGRKILRWTEVLHEKKKGIAFHNFNGKGGQQHRVEAGAYPIEPGVVLSDGPPLR